jgi:prolyl oligopeptidase
MKKIAVLFVVVNVTGAVYAQVPATPKKTIVDNYFGMQVSDNYRWLENTKDSTVQKWFKAQADYTNSVIDKIQGRDSLIKTLKYYDSLEPFKIRGIIKKGGRYFYKKTLPAENVGKLYYRTGENGKEILLYNPLPIKGKQYSINYFQPSEDGKKIAFGISVSGSETSTIYVMNVDTKKLYPEKIYPSWFGVSGWSADNKGFIYTIQNSGDNMAMNSMTDTRSMYHVVGTKPATDKLIFSRKKYPHLGITPEDLCFVGYSEDLKYIFGILAGVNREINCFYAPTTELFKSTIGWKRLFKIDDHVTNFVFKGDDVYMLTYEGATKFKITKTNVKKFSVADAETIIPEQQATIDNISRGKDFMYFTTNDGINSRAYQYDFVKGKSEEIKLPVSGTAYVGPVDIKSNEVQLGITAWKQPFTIYDYNPLTGVVKPSVWTPKVEYPGVEDVVVEEKEIKGLDGTTIPLTIMYNKNVKRDGSAVCYMTGYGAYGISSTPYFSIYELALMNKGVIVAETHVRGGGEKGQDWYKAGYKTTKPNTWKDFIASGQYLVDNHYTSTAHLIGEGTSAGGVLIGRAITERPDLFAAAISNVSCSNALRMENSPNGLNNTKEFGTVKDSVEARGLYEMDAFQHVKEGTAYPAVICIGGMNDPRVIVWQPGKFAAALQNATTSGKPVLMSVNYDNGHFTENKEISYRNFANQYAFALWQAGHPDFQPAK